jgi:hypothetical protein
VTAARQTGIIVGMVLACVWLAYSGPGYCDSPSLFSYLVLLVLLLPLFQGVFEAATPGPRARYAAVFAVAWYGLNPANTLTLVDFTRRPVLWSTLGMVAGLVLYQWRPGWRKYGVYLLPVAGAVCCHRATLVFAPLLFVFVFFTERNAEWRAFPAVLLRCIPAALVSLPALLLVRGGPPIPGETPPVAAARTLATFLAPFGLAGLDQLGVPLFIMLLGASVATALWRETRLMSLGLWWFLILLAAAPGEPLPACIGLTLSGSWMLARTVGSWRGLERALVPAGCACLLIVSAFVTEQKIDVLGHGVDHVQVFKSRNPEPWLSLSLFYHQAGRYADSIAAATTALRLKPDYAEAYNNICTAYGGLKMWNQAIQAAQEALKLKPDFPLARNNLAWAEQQQRLESQ